MKNYISTGATLVVAAPYALTAGQGFKVGDLFGVAQDNAASGDQTLMVRDGAFELAKDTSAPAQGGIAYWDDAAKKITTTATSNKKIGLFIAGAVTGDATCRVVLVPSI